MQFYVYITLFSLGAIVQAMSKAEEDKMFMDTIDACGKELGASDDDMNAVKNQEKQLSDSAKCITACVMKKFNLVGADGKLSMDGVKKMTEDMHPNDSAILKISEEIANKCMDAADAGDSECEATYKYTNCYYEEIGARGMA